MIRYEYVAECMYRRSPKSRHTTTSGSVNDRLLHATLCTKTTHFSIACRDTLPSDLQEGIRRSFPHASCSIWSPTGSADTGYSGRQSLQPPPWRAAKPAVAVYRSFVCLALTSLFISEVDSPRKPSGIRIEHVIDA